MAVNNFYDAPPLLREFLNYLTTVKGKSPLTVSEYYGDLKLFFKYLKCFRKLSDKPIEETDISDIEVSFVKSVSYADILEFLTYTAIERKNQAAARARKCSAIRGFFGYMQKRGIIELNPAKDLETPKLKRTLPRYLSFDDSVALLNAIDGTFKERDYCIITLFLNCGMRLSELVGINMSDINENTVTVTGKGNKQRTLFLNPGCRAAIKDYLAVRPVDGVKDKDALFLSRLKKRISPKTVQWVIYSTLEKAGLGDKHLSTHKLRHTAATLMYQNGADVRVLQDILGHENLNTTQIYTHIKDDQVETAMSLNPLGKIKKKKSKEE